MAIVTTNSDNSQSTTDPSDASQPGNVAGESAFANKQISIRLDDTNFLLWKQQVVLMIRGHDLEYLLDESTPIPPKVITGSNGQIALNPDYRRFKKLDSSLASWLLSTISPNIFPQLVGAETTASIWNTVLKQFSQLSTTKVMNLHCRLRALKKGALSIRDYTTQIKEICDLLATSGSPVSEVEQIATVLNGLPIEFEPFIAAITVSREPYTLGTITSVLMDAESRLSDPMRALVGINLTQFNNTEVPGGGSDRNTIQGSGYVGGRSSNNQTGGRFKGRPRPQCQLCGKIGHLVDRCWHRFDHSFKGVTAHTAKPVADTQANLCQFVTDTSDSGYNPYVGSTATTVELAPNTSEDTSLVNSLVANATSELSFLCICWFIYDEFVQQQFQSAASAQIQDQTIEAVESSDVSVNDQELLNTDVAADQNDELVNLGTRDFNADHTDVAVTNQDQPNVDMAAEVIVDSAGEADDAVQLGVPLSVAEVVPDAVALPQSVPKVNGL
ncbi:hypothetical protein GQ457_14G020810 [Hibiscus cannabinus]